MINMQQLMQQAQAMQKKIQSSQAEMKNKDFVGEANSGNVKITLNGLYEMKRVEINENLLTSDNKEILEDLILVAYNNCKSKIDKENEGNLGALAGNSNLLNGMF